MDEEDLLSKSKRLIDNLGRKQTGPTEESIQVDIVETARKYTDETFNNPTPSDYLLIQNVMLIGWQMGIQHAIAHMREKGITFSE